MSSIILPIKSKYVTLIFNNSKRYEFRKIKCKDKIERIYIYETSPIKSVVGEVEVLDILEGTPKEIWSLCNQYGGIEKIDFDNYFLGKSIAIAYKLGNIKKYAIPKKLSDFGIKSAPQSYVYLKDNK